MRILITGVGGFIGFHVAKKLISKGNVIIGIDNVNTYYDTKLKKKRIEILKKFSKKINHFFCFLKLIFVRIIKLRIF